MHYTEKWEKKEIESKESVKHALEKIVSKYNYNNTKCIVESGVPTHCILSVAESMDIDLIIIGTHGVHGWKRLLGGTAEYVLHNAKCDVLCVRAQGTV